MKTVEKKLEVDGVTLRVSVVRKRVKNVNARLRGNHLSISAPPSIPDDRLDTIVEELARKLVRRARAAQVNDSDDAHELACTIASRFPDPPRVTGVRFVTTQTRRWGSYSLRTGIVRLNAVLRQMPRWVLEAVVAHELAHVVHSDHGPAFWQLLTRVCPATERAQGFLGGVTWLAGCWDELPPVERALLAEAREDAPGEFG